MTHIKEERIGYAFYSEKHKTMSKHWLAQPCVSRHEGNNSSESNENDSLMRRRRYEDKYYVSAEEPRIVEITVVSAGPELSSKNYRWSDVKSVGRIYLDSFMLASEYASLSEDDRQRIIDKYWKDN